MIRPSRLVSRLPPRGLPPWPDDGRRRVVLTGAAGRIGTVLRRLLERDFAVRGVDIRPGHGVDAVVDLARSRFLPRVVAGAEAIVDLAGDPRVQQPWSSVLGTNARIAVNVFEAARVTGVPRIVYGSSYHVSGGHLDEEPFASVLAGRLDGLDPHALPRIDSRWPVRPDSPYAIGKLLAEAAARHYADRHGITSVCLRLGHVNLENRPKNPTHRVNFLTHDDLDRLVRAALDARPPGRFAVAYGMSANTWRVWDLDEARATIGYEPLDDVESLFAS